MAWPAAYFICSFIISLPFYQGQVDVSVLLGASAGVSAIIVAAATLVPNHSFVLLFIGPVKIKYIAIFYVIFKSFAGLDGPNAGGELAHLGGALIGYLYVVQLRKGNDIGGWISGFFGWIKGLFQRKPKIRVTHKQNTYTGSQSSYSAPPTAPQCHQKHQCQCESYACRAG